MCKARLTASRRIHAIFNWLPDCQTAILILSSFKRFPRRRAQLTPLPSFLALSGSANIELVFNNTSIYNHLFSSEFRYTEFTFNVTASFPASFLQFVFGNGNAGTFTSMTSAWNRLWRAFLMAALQLPCSAALCSAWLACGANGWVRLFL